MLLRIPLSLFGILDTGLSPSMAPLSRGFSYPLKYYTEVLQPHPNKSGWFRLIRVRSPLLTESLCFLFLCLLRCFTSAGSLPGPMCSDQDDFDESKSGCPIRISPGQSVLAAYRSLSQLATSFIVWRRQGIHLLPLTILYLSL